MCSALAFQSVGGSALALVFSGVALVAAWGVYSGRIADIRIQPSALILALPLPLIALLSALATGDGLGMYTIFGVSLEHAAVGAFLLYAAAFMTGASLGKSQARGMLVSLELLGVGIALAALYAAFVPVPPGAWLWEGAAFTAAASVLVASARLGSARGWREILFHVSCGLVSLSALLALFVQAAVLSALIAALLLTVFIFLRTRRLVASAAPAILSLLLTLVLLSGTASPLLKLNGSARPSPRVSQLIIGQEYLESARFALVGVGPGRFSWAWNVYRPESLNNSSAWSYTPQSSYSTLMTYAAEIGILGLLALLLLPLLVWLRYLRLGILQKTGSSKADAFLSLSVLVVAGAVLFPLESALLATGLFALGFVMQSSGSPPTAYSVRGRRRVPAALTLLCAGALLLWPLSHQLVAAYFAHAGEVSARREGKTADIAAAYRRAADTWAAPEYQKETALWMAKRGYEALTSIPRDDEQVRTSFRRSTEYADYAVTEVPKDFGAVFFRASLYTEFTESGLVNDVSDRARESLEQAAILAPTRPDVPYMTARLLRALGYRPQAREQLQKALQLKPDYADAEDLLEKI